MKRIPLLVAVCGVLALSGCATSLTPQQQAAQLEGYDLRTPDLAKTAGLDLGTTAVVGATPKAVPLDAPANEALPAHTLPQPLRLDNARLEEALTLALVGTNIDYVLVPGAEATTQTAKASGLKGDLTQVLGQLADLYGFFWSYEKGTLRIETDRQYLLELPPVKEVATAVERVLTERGARSVSVDAVSGHATYRATYPVAKMLDRYIEQTLNQPLLTYELTVLEVRLTSGQQSGIEWNKFDYLGTGNTQVSFSGATAPPSLLNASALSLAGIVGKKFSLDVLLKFLATQGTVTTISQPRVQLLSGGKTELRIGDTVRYVSKVGANAVVGASVAQTTAETTDLDTGIHLKLGGRVWQETVVTTLQLELSELLGFDTIQVGTNQQLKLPRTSKRTMSENVLRLKAGEPGLLFGLITTRNGDTRNSLTNAPVLNELTTTYRDNTKERAELVVVLVPRVIRFVADAADGKGSAQ